MANYVLVHGAWQTGAELETVASLIQAMGHDVHAPTIKGNRPGDSKTTGLAEAIESIVEYPEDTDLEADPERERSELSKLFNDDEPGRG